MKTTRMPGFFYLGMILFGSFAEMTRSKLFALPDIGASLLPLRLSLMSDLAMCVFHLLAAWALFNILKYYSKPLSLLFLIFAMTSVAILSGNLINHIAIIEMHSADYFGTANIQPIARFLAQLHGYGYIIAQVYFALWLMPLGMVLLKSKLMPACFGIMLIAATFGALTEVITKFLIPGYGYLSYPGLILGMIGEFSFCFWLLFRGIRIAGGKNDAPETGGCRA